MNRDKLPWRASVAVLVSFVAGCVVSSRAIQRAEAPADGNRVFELMIYHTRPGKRPALESLFRDAAKVISKHGMEVVGYWVPTGDPAWADTFIYLVAHPSLEDAKQRWDVIHKDPTMRVYIREAADNIIEQVDQEYRVDEVYMRPTDFSAMK